VDWITCIRRIVTR